MRMSAPLTRLGRADVERIGPVERIDDSGDELPLGRVTWLDGNGNALSDAEIASSPLAGVQVSLRDESGAEVARTITDARGNYLFDDLMMGQYTVVFTAPSSVIAAAGLRDVTSSRVNRSARSARAASSVLSAVVPVDLEEPIPTTAIQTWSVTPTGWGDRASVLRVAGTLG
jgi:SdrD B-like domain